MAGAGLGLSICQAIAAAHGGHIELTSAFGQGTTVRVYLPAVQDAPTARAASHV
jgi:signal transduction histidine kinase